MPETQRVEIEWGGRKLSLETGRVARQADAAVLAQYGETAVLATVVAEKTARPGIDFFPLTVNYQERTYAAGKIPGGFFKREGRPSEKETLTSRLIDRPIRPLFVEGFKYETQVIVTVLSHDMENDPDIVAMVAASAALTLSGVPGPVPPTLASAVPPSSAVPVSASSTGAPVLVTKNSSGPATPPPGPPLATVM